MNTRHPNCTPMTVSTDRQPLVSLSSQSRKAERLKIEKDVREYLDKGGKIEQLESFQERSDRACFFNVGPLQRGELG